MDSRASLHVRITDEEREKLLSGELKHLFVQFDDTMTITNNKGDTIGILKLTSVTRNTTVNADQKIKDSYPETKWRDGTKIYKLHFKLEQVLQGETCQKN